MLVIPGEQMLDLMVRIGIALRETADCGGSLPPQGSRKLKLAADPLCPAITIGQGQPATRSRATEAAMEASLRSLASAVAARSAKRQRTSRWSGECPELHRPSCVKPFQRRDRGGKTLLGNAPGLFFRSLRPEGCWQDRAACQGQNCGQKSCAPPVAFSARLLALLPKKLTFLLSPGACTR